jgi:hypothetical protein
MMNYKYKYAMPVDPKVLKQDFESSSEVKEINEILDLMRSVTPNTFHTVSRQVNSAVINLWLFIDSKSGINLRDREKVLPIFEEYARLCDGYSEGLPTDLFRGVSLPEIYGDLLSETFGTQTGTIKLTREIKTIFENLAYGLRSWTTDPRYALGFTQFTKGVKDPIIFNLSDNFEDDVVLDGNALRKFLSYMPEYRSREKSVMPVDNSEYIVFLKKPKIKSVTRTHFKGNQYVWRVNIL